jgi:uncharacterized protein with HEPN domain
MQREFDERPVWIVSDEDDVITAYDVSKLPAVVREEGPSQFAENPYSSSLFTPDLNEEDFLDDNEDYVAIQNQIEEMEEGPELDAIMEQRDEMRDQIVNEYHRLHSDRVRKVNNAAIFSLNPRGQQDQRRHIRVPEGYRVTDVFYTFGW